jgi:hypothetical protein
MKGGKYKNKQQKTKAERLVVFPLADDRFRKQGCAGKRVYVEINGRLSC